jgi:hypothetical protein
MVQTVTRLVTGLSLFLLAGCTSTLYTHPLRVSEPSEPSAELIIFRENAVMGSAWAIPVYLMNEKLARLRKGTYARFAIKPGNYDLRVGEESTWTGLTPIRRSTRSMNFVAGGKYFILLTARRDLLAFGPDQYFFPIPITEDRAKILMKEYSLVQ